MRTTVQAEVLEVVRLSDVAGRRTTGVIVQEKGLIAECQKIGKTGSGCRQPSAA